MLAFARGNLAAVDRDMRIALEHLRFAKEGGGSLFDIAERVSKAAARLEFAIETLDGAIRLEEMSR